MNDNVSNISAGISPKPPESSGAPLNRNQRTTLLIAFCGVLFGLYLLAIQLHLQYTGAIADGRIVARDSAKFVVKYNVNGRDYEITESLPGKGGFKSRQQLQEGATVQVLYDSVQPEKAQWHSSRNLIFPVIIVVMSALFAAIILNPKLLGRNIGGRSNFRSVFDAVNRSKG